MSIAAPIADAPPICAQVDPELFYPPSGHAVGQIRAALLVCAQCPAAVHRRCFEQVEALPKVHSGHNQVRGGRFWPQLANWKRDAAKEVMPH